MPPTPEANPPNSPPPPPPPPPAYMPESIPGTVATPAEIKVSDIPQGAASCAFNDCPRVHEAAARRRAQMLDSLLIAPFYLFSVQSCWRRLLRAAS